MSFIKLLVTIIIQFTVYNLSRCVIKINGNIEVSNNSETKQLNYNYSFVFIQNTFILIEIGKINNYN